MTNNTSLSRGLQTIRFGARFRSTHITSISPQNFGGTWIFAGSRQIGNPNAITSIKVYQTTQQGLQSGLAAPVIRAAGGGATQFTISAGNPKTTVSQIDFGGFAQDDWRVRPNLMLSFGLRYENQNNINSNLNFAPRFGFAWQPGTSSRQIPSKTTVRGGFGVFYDRVGENLTLTANRLNGINQQQFNVTDPVLLNAFPNIPSISALTAFKTPLNIYQLAQDLEAPYTMQSAISVERALPHNFTTSVTFSHARTLHLLRARAINAPLPVSGVRPLGVNNFFEYDSTGRFDQNQLIVTLGSRLSRNASFNINYTYSRTNSDSDGAGTFAANPFDFSSEYGRSSNDVRHRFTLFGNFRTRWGISLNPFLIVASGAPFNITVGRDLNGDTIFADRPAFATDLTKPGVIMTKFGAFDPNPTLASQIIPRNFGSGPGSLIANLRVSKTWGFGGERRVASTQRPGQGNRGGGAERGGGAPRGGGLGAMGGGGARGGGGGGGGGARGGGGGFGGGGGDAAKRYNLTLSINFQNILNHTNLGRPIGNLSSSLFGLSTSSAGGFGGFGGGRGGGGSSPYNRLIEAQIRFSF